MLYHVQQQYMTFGKTTAVPPLFVPRVQTYLRIVQLSWNLCRAGVVTSRKYAYDRAYHVDDQETPRIISLHGRLSQRTSSRARFPLVLRISHH